MHISASPRLRAVRIAAILTLSAAGCASSSNGSAAPPPASASSPAQATQAPAPPSVSASALASAAASQVLASLPPMAAIEPSAVIVVPDATGAIEVTTDGKTVWAATNGAVVRIDAATNAARRLKAPAASDDTTLAIAVDGLWATRWQGGMLYRLDPQTGAVLLSVAMPRAVRIAFVGEDMWVGREDLGSMLRVDRKTGAVGATVTQGAYGTAGMGDLWFASGGSPTILRVDPSTRATTATIAAPGETNCAISGSFPDNIWIGCGGPEVVPRTVARIDPATDTVAAVVTLPPAHGAGTVIVDGATWIVTAFPQADGSPSTGLLRVDPHTGAIERFLLLRGVDPDPPVVAGGALWIPDEAGHRILRVDAATLSG